MIWFKQNPLFAIVLLFVVVAISAEAWLWCDGHAQGKKALANLAQQTQERDWLAAQKPALSKENETAIAEELVATKKNLAELRAALAGKDERLLAVPLPAQAIDLYFDIAAFVERTRALAGRAQVVIKPDERFSFASHANEGPELDLVPAVFRQRLLAQYIIEALIEARPLALLSIQRERPMSAAARAQRNQPVDPSTHPATTNSASANISGHPTDFFEIDRALSLRVLARIESDAFKVEFTGQTPSLRAFLNTLVEFRLPLIVRSVEVEPLGREGSVAGAGTPEAAAPVPLVTQNFSKFSVVVELVSFLVTPEPPAP
ncbi:hypothetical protein [Oleiharenicola lentus]|uniref:hypothetical protein n=1 Tax=Oleiharenicola lentus TaxID=2508720 RepID=UPI003F66746E